MFDLSELWDDEDDVPDNQWYKDGNCWVLHRNGKTVIVERIGWLFHRWRYIVVQDEGTAPTLQEAKQKAESATAPRPTILRLIRK